ncbi:uncharacterized protein LOC116346556 [Contarinia nasturtii]|uniref:uncharacterized protein LOC116346556 n=1 Tax=Contarinia nasturtii TaxID=265458 RepID=UPI0012D44EA9|nr:uncharacterized protein LOC116346556 [Contarinia nasturtii]
MFFFFVFFAAICALHVHPSCGGGQQELTALVKGGTASSSIRFINAAFEESKTASSGKKVSAIFECSSIDAVPLDPKAIFSLLNRLNLFVAKNPYPVLQVNLNIFYNALKTFPTMMATFKKTMQDAKLCCELYQKTQETLMNAMESNEEKLKLKLKKISQFETKLFYKLFMPVPSTAQLLQLTIETYIKDIAKIINKMNQINNARQADKPIYAAELDSMLELFARDDVKFIKTLNDDVTRLGNEKCPDIKKHFNGLY